MPSWFRGDKEQAIPEWAKPLTPEQYKRYLEIVRKALDDLGISGDRQPDANGILKVRNQEGNEIQAGLANLAQLVARAPGDVWLQLVRNHFSALLAPMKHPTDRASALSALRARFWPPEFFQQAPDAIHRTLAPGLELGLVVDLPTAIASVKSEQLKQWELSEEEAWSAAEQNTAKEPVEVVPKEGPGGATINFLVGDNFYASSHVLWLDRHVKVDPNRGALVGIPTRHLGVIHPIEDLRVVQVVQLMIHSTRSSYEKGPGSITPELYWWRNGEFVLMSVKFEKEKIAFAPPDSFAELLNTLPPPPK